MNTIRAIIASLFAVLILGCADIIPKTVVAVDKVVDAGMAEWAHAKNEGLTTPQIDKDVTEAYALYQEACARALPIYELAVASNDTGGKLEQLRKIKDAANLFLDELAPILIKDRIASLKLDVNNARTP